MQVATINFDLKHTMAFQGSHLQIRSILIAGDNITYESPVMTVTSYQKSFFQNLIFKAHQTDVILLIEITPITQVDNDLLPAAPIIFTGQSQFLPFMKEQFLIFKCNKQEIQLDISIINPDYNNFIRFINFEPDILPFSLTNFLAVEIQSVKFKVTVNINSKGQFILHDIHIPFAKEFLLKCVLNYKFQSLSLFSTRIQVIPDNKKGVFFTLKNIYIKLENNLADIFEQNKNQSQVFYQFLAQQTQFKTKEINLPEYTQVTLNAQSDSKKLQKLAETFETLIKKSRVSLSDTVVFQGQIHFNFEIPLLNQLTSPLSSFAEFQQNFNSVLAFSVLKFPENFAFLIFNVRKEVDFGEQEFELGTGNLAIVKLLENSNFLQEINIGNTNQIVKIVGNQKKLLESVKNGIKIDVSGYLRSEQFFTQNVNISKEMVKLGCQKGYFIVKLDRLELIFFVKKDDSIELNQDEIAFSQAQNQEFQINEVQNYIAAENQVLQRSDKCGAGFLKMKSVYYADIIKQQQEEISRKKKEGEEAERLVRQLELEKRIQEEAELERIENERIKQEKLEKQNIEKQRLKELELQSLNKLKSFDHTMKSVRDKVKYQQAAEDELKMKIIQFEARKRAEDERKKEIERQRYELKKQQNLKFQQQKQIFQVVQKGRVLVDYQDENDLSSEPENLELRYTNLPVKKIKKIIEVVNIEVQPIFQIKKQPKVVKELPQITQKDIIKYIKKVTDGEFKYLHETKSEGENRLKQHVENEPKIGNENDDCKESITINQNASLTFTRQVTDEPLYYNCKSPIKSVKQNKMMRTLQSSPLMRNVGRIKK
ncbi:hypothetical protein SS50377_27920 [Spironucleus salmonicida]|uniref:Uncharacterized protein n=1 Tax=Spironucleus salmonicida TaxID=348837 RepID=V6LDC2_9EUKA|nr:hypothetical protein SS50377_27920 [Spironucleus salmonicida]|eukprot:EST42482.1 Hypothetical protein SS50377_17788 [Spironucleus salmonicida]